MPEYEVKENNHNIYYLDAEEIFGLIRAGSMYSLPFYDSNKNMLGLVTICAEYKHPQEKIEIDLRKDVPQPSVVCKPIEVTAGESPI
jgi:hypothetical protein